MSLISRLTIVCCVLLLCLGYSCKKEDKNDGTTNTDFDRKALLTNIGNNVIVPRYQAFQLAVNNLDAAIVAFNQSPDESKLQNLQNTFKDVYRSWQSCSTFGFGPAEQQFLNVSANTFPADSARINSNIATGTYDLNALSSLDVKGLPGIDYLLFGIGADRSAILAMYTTDNHATNRKQYLTALSADLKAKINAVMADWTSDVYLNTFMNAAGTDIGSSAGQLVNQLNYDLDLLKNYKLGIPLGKQSMGTIFPSKVEAYYSGISSELLLLQLKAMRDLYLGKSAAGDGVGFDDYLISLNAKYTNGGSLDDAIKNQFTVAITKLQAVPDPLSGVITSNPTSANEAYTEVQKLLVLLKTDMPSAMGILITYNDNDGD